MEISERQLKEFKNIYKNIYGISLQKEDAYNEALSLLQLIKLITDRNIKITKKGNTHEK